MDFREFLKDFIAHERTKHARLSLRAFCARELPALASSSLLSGVLKGKKNLGPTLRLTFAKALKLKSKDVQYFDLLVQFNQSSDIGIKGEFLYQLSKFKDSKAKLLSSGQYRYFTQWYYPVVWNYIGMNQKVSNPAAIGSALHPPITAAQAEEALQLLLDLGLIKRRANGYGVTEKHLATETEFRGLIAFQYNQHFLDLASNALRNVEAHHRQFGTMVFSVARDSIRQISEKMKSFQEEVQEIIDQDMNSDCVYTLGFQLFPNTKPPINI